MEQLFAIFLLDHWHIEVWGVVKSSFSSISGGCVNGYGVWSQVMIKTSQFLPMPCPYHTGNKHSEGHQRFDQGPFHMANLCGWNCVLSCGESPKRDGCGVLWPWLLTCVLWKHGTLGTLESAGKSSFSSSKLQFWGACHPFSHTQIPYQVGYI